MHDPDHRALAEFQTLRRAMDCAFRNVGAAGRPARAQLRALDRALKALPEHHRALAPFLFLELRGQPANDNPYGVGSGDHMVRHKAVSG